nr:MAG TPA: hypothetical protein [Caudoviricetes sp.]
MIYPYCNTITFEDNLLKNIAFDGLNEARIVYF